MQSFSPRTRDTLRSLAAAGIEAGQHAPSGGAATVARFESLARRLGPAWIRGIDGLSSGLDLYTRLRTGRRFSRLSVDRQQGLLQRLHGGNVLERLLSRALLGPLRAVHYDDADIYAALGQRFRAETPAAVEQPRWLQNATDLDELVVGEELEAEAVVVGTGAGGAVVAAELAQQGVAVVLLEEGGYFDRRHFDGRPLELQAQLYRDLGATSAVGNCWIPVALGKSVGGTTTINNGTCYRLPERVARKWREEDGLDELTEAELDRCFSRVERNLGIEPANPKYLGGVADVIARGCEALGITRHGPLSRNAPDCDGQGLCCWGCPTDAKKSTNVSYVPQALRAGAQLFYHARVERLVVEGGRAVGVEAVSPTGKRLLVRAPAVVLSAGAIYSPLLLLRHDLANSSGQVGRNLSLHPAVAVGALFDDKLGGARAIPQGYAIEAFHDEGLLYEGAFVPMELLALGLPLSGRRHTEVMEAYDRVAMFGFMIEDSSRGRVRRGPGGRPLLTYWLNPHDVARLKRGLEILFRVYLAAGAESVFPAVAGFDEIRDETDIERFRRAKLAARHFELSAYHPLGTARMGREPRTSVVGPTHETHDVRGLFVVDGAAVPSSIGVNPQLTIMALATRAARFIGDQATSVAS